MRSFGFLDEYGEAVATYAVSAAFNPALARTVVHHAYIATDAVTNELLFASEAVALELTP